MNRPDGGFEIVPRSGAILISKASDGVTDPLHRAGQTEHLPQPSRPAAK